MSDEGMSDHELERWRFGLSVNEPQSRVPITNSSLRRIIARLDAAERERDALREALREIVTSDSPLGRNGVPSHKEIARRALKGIDHE